MTNNCKRQSPARWSFKDFPTLSGQGRIYEPMIAHRPKNKSHNKLIQSIIVARERPRTSESITDLLSPTASPDQNISSLPKNSKVCTLPGKKNLSCCIYIMLQWGGLTPPHHNSVCWSRQLSKLMRKINPLTSQRPCTTFNKHKILKELQSDKKLFTFFIVNPHGVLPW